MKKETLHIYIRVSSDSSVKKDNSLPAQKLAGERKAEQLGMNCKVWVEPGQSASVDTLDNRPVLNQVLELCAEGEIKHLFVTEFDRLTRNRKTEIEIKYVLAKYKVLLHTTGQTYDFNDAEDDFISGILTLVASREVKIKNKRIKRSLLESARKGKAGGGASMPYGYKKDENKMLVIDAEEAKVVERIFRLSLSGKGSNTIAELLNEEGIETRGRKSYKNGLKWKNKYTGKVTHTPQSEITWKPNTIITMLKNTLYKGERQFKGEVFPAPVIIAPAMWEAVQKNLIKNRSYVGGNTRKHFYLLKGLIRCAKCGRNLYGYIKSGTGKPDTKNPRGDKHQQVYMCSSKREHFCGMKSINIQRLNELVWDAVGGSSYLLKQLEAEIKNGNKNSHQRIAELEKSLKLEDGKMKEVKQKQANLITLFEKGRIELDTFDIRNDLLKGEQSSIEAEKAAISKEIAFISRKEKTKVLSYEFLEMISGLEQVSELDKQKLLNQLVKEVTVDYDAGGKQHLVKVEINMPNQHQAKEVWISENGKPSITFEDEQIARDYFEIAGRIVQEAKKSSNDPEKNTPVKVEGRKRPTSLIV